MRHSYATAGQDAQLGRRALSARIGYADEAFTMQQYVQADLVADRQAGSILPEPVNGALQRRSITRPAGTAPKMRHDLDWFTNPVYRTHEKRPGG